MIVLPDFVFVGHRGATVTLATAARNKLPAVYPFPLFVAGGGLDERPPTFQLLALGLQHASAICPYLVMVALVAGAAKLPHEAARNAMALAMVAVAFLTILQSLRFGWLGSGYLCPPVVSAIYLPSSMAAATTFGFPAMCGMVMFAGGCEALVARYVRKLRKLFEAFPGGGIRRSDHCCRN